VCPTHRQTDTQTTPRATSVTVGRIYVMRAMWPKMINLYLEVKSRSVERNDVLIFKAWI